MSAVRSRPAQAVLVVLTALATVLAGGPPAPPPVPWQPGPGGQADALRLRGGASGYAAAVRQAGDVPTSPLTTLHPWVERGPSRTGGRITDLALDPDSGTVWVAAASGGVWRSTDGGRTLQPAWPPEATPAIGAITRTADGAILAGTGEANAGGGSTTFTGDGVYRSVDDGATWTHAGLAESGTIARLVAHPTDPDVVWAAAGGDLFVAGGQRGIYRSDDGGRSWTPVLAGATDTTGGADLAIDPADPDHLLAAMWDRRRTPALRQYGGPGSGLYESTDGGDTWRTVTEGIPGFTEDAGRIAVAFSPVDPAVAYAVVTRGDGRAGGLHRSDDGGRSWRLVNDGPLYAASQFIFGWWFSKVFPAPDDPDRVLVPGLSLLESTDGGESFTVDARVHPDHHALVWDPDDPSRAWLGSDGGLYASEDGGATGTWTLAAGQRFTQAYTAAVPPTAPDRVVAGFQDIGCMLVDGDQPWASSAGCGDGLVALPHPSDPDDVILCGQYGRCRRTTGFDQRTTGLTAPPVQRAGWGAPLVRVPGDPDHLLLGGERLVASRDHGRTWTPVSQDLTRGQSPDLDYPYGTISEILVRDDGGESILVGTDDGLLWATEDGGSTWRLLLDEEEWITGIAARGDVLLVATSGYFAGDRRAHVRRSADGGATWTSVADGLPNAPLNDVLLLGDAAVVASDVGVFVAWEARTAERPRWRRVGAALPQAPVLDLDHVDGEALLTVATFGRGVWQIRLPSTDRTAGPDRWTTAADVAGDGPAETVVLASGTGFADALTAGALVARQPGWRLLLTDATTLPDATADALRQTAPSRVLVVGGPTAVSDAVAAQAAAVAGVPAAERVAGADRYATAAAVAGRVPPREALLATAGSPFDALSAAALAAATDATVLLVDPDRLPAATERALRDLAPDRVTAIGGTAAIGAEVLAAAARAADAPTARIAGADRVDTAQRVGLAAVAAGTASTIAWLASATSPADALAAAATGRPVLLTGVNHVEQTLAALRDLGPRRIRIAGGPAAVPPAVEEALRHGPVDE